MVSPTVRIKHLAGIVKTLQRYQKTVQENATILLFSADIQKHCFQMSANTASQANG